MFKRKPSHKEVNRTLQEITKSLIELFDKINHDYDKLTPCEQTTINQTLKEFASHTIRTLEIIREQNKPNYIQ